MKILLILTLGLATFFSAILGVIACGRHDAAGSFIYAVVMVAAVTAAIWLMTED